MRTLGLCVHVMLLSLLTKPKRLPLTPKITDGRLAAYSVRVPSLNGDKEDEIRVGVIGGLEQPYGHLCLIDDGVHDIPVPHTVVVSGTSKDTAGPGLIHIAASTHAGDILRPQAAPVHASLTGRKKRKGQKLGGGTKGSLWDPPRCNQVFCHPST